ncbi:unnamed protein product [Peniophora sp. CBMAI 1063]|nr:unnamed protein product [Peniophora sp. CBMAI 1063]
MTATTTTALSAPPVIPFYLSHLSPFFLHYVFSTSNSHLRQLLWEHSQVVVDTYPAAFGRQTPKLVPSIEDGKNMAERYRKRNFEPSTQMAQLIRKFQKPYGMLKRVHGRSKLCIEIIPGEGEDGEANEELDINYRPVRSTLRHHMATYEGESRLYQMTREGEVLLAARQWREDPRKVPPNNDAKVWEDLFGKFRHGKSLSGKREKALSRRGCWRNGKVVSVVDDEIFPGWGEKWEVDEDGGEAPRSIDADSADTLLANASRVKGVESLGMQTLRLGEKRQRDEDDASEEHMGAVKKPRTA